MLLFGSSMVTRGMSVFVLVGVHALTTRLIFVVLRLIVEITHITGQVVYIVSEHSLKE